MKRTHVVACLAGDGLGPELMAEASRALHALSGLHGFRVRDVHVPFGTEALTRAGHRLPVSTRSAYLEADAILVAAEDPALEDVESELDLRACVLRVRFAGGGFALVSPLSDEACEWTVERAFEIARSSRARLASVDAGRQWRDLVDGVAERYDAVLVDHLTVAEGLPALAFEPERFDVLVTGPLFADALEGIAATLEREARVVARGRLAASGPGVFAPVQGDPPDAAGQGVADPSSMLLAVSLMLAEGLGERAAAETLAGAITAARIRGATPRLPVWRRPAATTREFADAVLAMVPGSVRNAEFLGGVHP